MTTDGVIPEAYRGREQALVKHKLLSSYLEKLVLIIGMAGKSRGTVEIAYVDCFAGPWGDDTDALESTSIAKSLAILEKCREELGARSVNCNIRALYIEKNSEPFAKLEKFLTDRKNRRVRTHCMNGDFVELRDTIISWCGDHTFVFFFIDPKGWTEVGVEILRPLLIRPRSEFLINFQYDFVNRAASIESQRANVSRLVGESIDVEGLDPQDREALLIKCYLRNLKKKMHADELYPPRAAYVRVLSPDRDRLKYHLVYLTTHPRGIVEFMERSEAVDFTQLLIRATKREEAREHETRTTDFFGPQSLVSPEDTRTSPAVVDRFWLGYLSKEAKRLGLNEFAVILESTNWFPGDLQSSLARLIKTGRVRNLDAMRIRPKRPLHWEASERLQLSNEAE